MVTPKSKKSRITSDHSPKSKLITKTKTRISQSKRKEKSQSIPNTISKKSNSNKLLLDYYNNKYSYKYNNIQIYLSNSIWNNKVNPHDIEEFGKEWIVNNSTGSQSPTPTNTNTDSDSDTDHHPSIMCMIGGYQNGTKSAFSNRTHIEYLVHVKLYEIEPNYSNTNIEKGRSTSTSTGTSTGTSTNNNSNNSNINLIGSVMILRRYSAFEELKESILELELELELEGSETHENIKDDFKQRLVELFPEKHQIPIPIPIQMSMNMNIPNSIVSYLFNSDSNTSTGTECNKDNDKEGRNKNKNESDEVFLIKRQCRLQYWLNFILFYLTNQYQYYQQQLNSNDNSNTYVTVCMNKDTVAIAIAKLHELRHLLVVFLSTP